MKHPHLIHSRLFGQAVTDDPLTLVDVGARGRLDPPWDAIPPGALQVIGFEPDVEECARLSAQAPGGMRFLPIALWSQPAEVEVHVAATPSCSSVHPPNDDLLRDFADEHVAPRTTATKVRYPANTLDAVLAVEGLGCDFLKIDTQGAEGEIVRGASATLRDRAMGALIETWTLEVHRGQQLTGAIMSQMDELGFQLFDMSVGAAWQRRRKGAVDLLGKAQVVGLDLLYLRHPAGGVSGQVSDLTILKAAALAEVFGFPDVALELIGTVDSAQWAEEARDVVRASARGRRTPVARARRVLRRIRSLDSGDFAPLHA
jgi:FkbM family methyltransferase